MLNPNSSTRSLGFSLCNCFAIQIPSQARNDINFSFANVMQIFFQKMHVMLNLIQHLSIHRFRVKLGMTSIFHLQMSCGIFSKNKSHAELELVHEVAWIQHLFYSQIPSQARNDAIFLQIRNDTIFYRF